MDNLLEQFYWGKLQPDTMTRKGRRRFREESEKYLELEEKFQALIGEAAAEAYEELTSHHNGLQADKEAMVFAGGFKLGALFMIEVLG